jgi:hypothetical protein
MGLGYIMMSFGLKNFKCFIFVTESNEEIGQQLIPQILPVGKLQESVIA